MSVHIKTITDNMPINQIAFDHILLGAKAGTDDIQVVVFGFLFHGRPAPVAMPLLDARRLLIELRAQLSSYDQYLKEHGTCSAHAANTNPPTPPTASTSVPIVVSAFTAPASPAPASSASANSATPSTEFVACTSKRPTGPPNASNTSAN